MPSEDSKPAVKRSKAEEGVEEEDKRSLGSILKDKNSSRALVGASKAARVKKEEPDNGGGSSEKKPPRVGYVAGDRGAKVKKEAKEQDDDDDVPISKKASSAKNDKVVLGSVTCKVWIFWCCLKPEELVYGCMTWYITVLPCAMLCTMWLCCGSYCMSGGTIECD